MKGEMLFVENSEELEQLESLNLPTEGQEVWNSTDFWFKLKDIESMCLTDTGNINIFMYGVKTTLKYDKELFDKIVNALE